eukprot:3967201-Prymnesium_polylepis.1
MFARLRASSGRRMLCIPCPGRFLAASELHFKPGCLDVVLKQLLGHRDRSESAVSAVHYVLAQADVGSHRIEHARS